MTTRIGGPRTPLLVGVLAGFLAAVALVLPWFSLGSKSRSSIDLIASLGALDVIEGGVKLLVVLSWLATPLLVCGAMFAAAAGRDRLAAFLLLPLGVVIGGVVGLVLLVAFDSVAWGAYVAALFALTASVSAIIVLVRTGSARGGVTTHV